MAAAGRPGGASHAGSGASSVGSAGGRRLVIEGKVIVIGSVSVGKTSLLGRLTKPHADIKTVRPSVGVSFLQHTIEGRDATLRASLWDTAGQERFRAMSSLYYRLSAAAVLVFDVTSRQSFDDLPFFLSNVQSTAGTPHVLFLVIGNKTDYAPSARAVATAEARAFAESIGALYCETSAQTGAGVRQAFAMLADAAPAFAAKQQAAAAAAGAAAQERSPMAGFFQEVAIARKAGSRPSLVVSEAAGSGGSTGGCC